MLFVGDVLRIGIFAVREVMEGDEILFDYGGGVRRREGPERGSSPAFGSANFSVQRDDAVQ